MWLSPTAAFLAVVARPGAAAPRLDVVMLFGFLAGIVTLLVYGQRHRSRATALSFASCLAALSAYAFLQGAWPLGFVELFWCVTAFRRALATTRRPRWVPRIAGAAAFASPVVEVDSRISRMFGPT